MKWILPFLVAVGVVGGIAVVPASAQSTTQDVAYGAGSVLGTAVYAPVKGAYCIIGAVTSGLTLPFGGTDTAGRVATAACAGTWAITPDVIRGKEKVRFVGGKSSP